MKISYMPLWHMLLDKNMNKQQFRELTGLSSSSVAKLVKGKSVTTEMLVRICERMGCNLSDIMVLVDENGTPVNSVNMRVTKEEA